VQLWKKAQQLARGKSYRWEKTAISIQHSAISQGKNKRTILPLMDTTTCSEKMPSAVGDMLPTAKKHYSSALRPALRDCAQAGGSKELDSFFAFPALSNSVALLRDAIARAGLLSAVPRLRDWIVAVSSRCRAG
jgi:hypothetical protein